MAEGTSGGHAGFRGLCRRLRPVLGTRIDRLWRVYLAESDPKARADLERTLELLAVKHLGASYEPNESVFPPHLSASSDTAGGASSNAGDLELGHIVYGPDSRPIMPFTLQSRRLKEHVLICGRSGSGKTNLTFVLLDAVMRRGIKVLAMDWKRGYRDLLTRHPDLRVYTVGRSVSPIRFNPLIPPPGCEPGVWVKVIVDVIASAYLGGEGVISLLVSGLDKLYEDAGMYEPHTVPTRYPTMVDLLEWLRSTKLRGRAAMWQASAERILQALTYGEFGAVINTQDNTHLPSLLDNNVILEMDGLSADNDRRMFSEALTLYLYRLRLAQGPRKDLTGLIVLEEAHNLLLRKAADARESVLETSIRMVRQYGLGYVFVDQSASMLSQVAFANSYATIALSQKLRGDVQAMAGAMNLDDDQKQALITLPVGAAVVRVADSHTRPLLIKLPLYPIEEGSVSDEDVRRRMTEATPSEAWLSRDNHGPPRVLDAPDGHTHGTTRGMAHASSMTGSDPTDSAAESPAPAHPGPVTPVPPPDNRDREASDQDPSTTSHQQLHPSTYSPTHHPRPRKSEAIMDRASNVGGATGYRVEPVDDPRAAVQITRDAARFMRDLVDHPLSTTVQRYQRLHLSRRKGNAIRQDLTDRGYIAPARLATRSGQVVLNDLTDTGREVFDRFNVELPTPPRESLEHRYWMARVQEKYEADGYEVELEFALDEHRRIDVWAQKEGELVAIEVETGKSDIKASIQKLHDSGAHHRILLATSAAAVAACQRAQLDIATDGHITTMTWLDVA
ncbi:MAG: DUF87 domain-containing protein [Planctomycetota bacterium]